MSDSKAVIEANYPLRADEKWALVQRIAASTHFQKAPKLREFLLFVCENTLQNNLEDVREQQIGVRVFHRRPDYNMSEDSIVRVQARELRKRLAAYFEQEGHDEPAVVTIPKGGYVPQFAARCATSVPEQATEADEPAHEVLPQPGKAVREIREEKSRNLRPLLLVVSVILIAAISFWLGRRQGAGNRSGAYAGDLKDLAVYGSLLGPMGLNGHDISLILSNPRVILYFGRSGSIPEPGNNLNIPVPATLQRLLSPAINLGEYSQARTYMSIVDDTYTGIGEASCAYNLGRLMQSLNRSVRLMQSRFLNWNDAKREDLIVLGNPQMNSWTLKNVQNYNFSFVEDGIQDHSPRAGEQPVYKTAYDKGYIPTLDYALIRMATSAAGSRILTIAGRSVSGTQGAGDFFTNPVEMKAVYKQLLSEAGGTVPENWELLLQINVRENIPVETKLVAVRAYGRGSSEKR